MPSLTEHCMFTKKRYGVTGRDIHKWMDEPVKLYGPNHRMVRHDKYQELPFSFIEKYGNELAYNIMLDHLLADQHTPDGLPIQIKRRKKPEPLIQKDINEPETILELPAPTKEDIAKPTTTKLERLLALLNRIEVLENKILEMKAKQP